MTALVINAAEVPNIGSTTPIHIWRKTTSSPRTISMSNPICIADRCPCQKSCSSIPRGRTPNRANATALYTHHSNPSVAGAAKRASPNTHGWGDPVRNRLGRRLNEPSTTITNGASMSTRNAVPTRRLSMRKTPESAPLKPDGNAMDARTRDSRKRVRVGIANPSKFLHAWMLTVRNARKTHRNEFGNEYAHHAPPHAVRLGRCDVDERGVSRQLRKLLDHVRRVALYARLLEIRHTGQKLGATRKLAYRRDLGIGVGWRGKERVIPVEISERWLRR